MIVHKSKEEWVQKALKEISKIDSVVGNPVIIRIEEINQG